MVRFHEQFNNPIAFVQRLMNTDKSLAFKKAHGCVPVSKLGMPLENEGEHVLKIVLIRFEPIKFGPFDVQFYNGSMIRKQTAQIQVIEKRNGFIEKQKRSK